MLISKSKCIAIPLCGFALLINLFDYNPYVANWILVAALLFLAQRQILSIYSILFVTYFYFAANLYFLDMKYGLDALRSYMVIVSIGFISFISTHSSNAFVETGGYLKTKKLMIKGLLIICFLFLITFGYRIGGYSIALGLHFLLTKMLCAIIFGMCFQLMKTRPSSAIILAALYTTLQLFSSLTAADFNRNLMIECLLLFSFMFLISYANGKILLQKLNFLPFVLIIFSIPVLLGLLISQGILQISGGDALIAIQAYEVINSHNIEYEPMMPLYNMAGNVIPSELYPGEKPKNFNPSAWYIDRVMNIDPSSYPFGIGISMFGASYLYGGLPGVIIIFMFLGGVFRMLESFKKTLFGVGLYTYFALKLPWGMYRMDETFIFGSSFILFLYFIYLYVNFNRKSL